MRKLFVKQRLESKLFMIERNESQKRAIAHLSGPMMVLAGPGSGKTSVIVERTEYMICQHGISESSILVVTFSKAAAREMKERFLARRKTERSGVTFGTFHGVFYGILKHAYHLNASNIIRPEQRNQFLKELVCSCCPDMKDEKEFLEDLAGEISLVKGNRVSLEHYYSTNCPDDAFRKIYRGYEARCRRERLLDFDDMLVQCYELFVQRPDILQGWQQKFQHILVDEFQDINQLQYDIIRMLAKPEDNLFIVGDDDQSIYHFRGARPEIMLNFKRDYPKMEQVVLDVNYRSTGTILQKASCLIGNNRKRYEKKLSTPNEGGAPVKIVAYQNPYEEAQDLCREIVQYQNEGKDLRQVAVLSRTNMEASVLVEKLMEYQIPFTIRDRLPNLYEHWIAANMMAYLSMGQGDMSRSNFLAVMNRPNRYISREAVYESAVSFESLRMFYEDKDWMCDRVDEMEIHIKRLKNMTPYAGITYIRHGIGYEEYLRDYALERKIKPEDLYEVLDRIQESSREYLTLAEWQEHIRQYTQQAAEQQQNLNEKGEGVTIATLHSSKGLEFDRVYIINVNENVIPYRKAQLDFQLEEERRLFYVGMTRARKELKLCYVYKQYDKKMKKSRFLDEIQ